jgi:hypothetical protein
MLVDRVDRLIQFILLAAGRKDDFFDRELGPIHLVKYVYLADLAYAARHEGETYTGAPWRFHHFGPWAPEVFARIEPAVMQIDAVERTFESRIDDDSRRWRATDEREFDTLERQLPHEVVSAICRSVREFGHDTSSLLHFVYQTPPMLHAAPGESLVFPTKAHVRVPAATAPPLSVKALKRRAERLRAGRELVRARLGTPSSVPTVKATPAPRYDEVFAQGVAWLDTLGGEAVPLVEGEAEFSPQIWKAPGRGDSDDE